MTEWRHAEERDPVEVDGTVGLYVCTVTIPPGRPWVCGCDSPTPDPASPCGHKRHRGDLPCGAPADDDWHDRRTWEQEPELWHRHVPTLCQSCGHEVTR